MSSEPDDWHWNRPVEENARGSHSSVRNLNIPSSSKVEEKTKQGSENRSNRKRKENYSYKHDVNNYVMRQTYKGVTRVLHRDGTVTIIGEEKNDAPQLPDISHKENKKQNHTLRKVVLVEDQSDPIGDTHPKSAPPATALNLPSLLSPRPLMSSSPRKKTSVNTTDPFESQDITFLTGVDNVDEEDEEVEEGLMDKILEELISMRLSAVRALKLNAESLLSSFLPLFNDDGSVAAFPSKSGNQIFYDTEQYDYDTLNGYLPVRLPAVKVYSYLTQHERGAFLNNLSDFNLTQFLSKPVAGFMMVSFFWYVVARCRRGWLEKILIGRLGRLQQAFDALYDKSDRSSEMTLPRLTDVETLAEELYISDALWREKHRETDQNPFADSSTLYGSGVAHSPNRTAELAQLQAFLDRHHFTLVGELPGLVRSGRLPDSDRVKLLNEALSGFLATKGEYEDLVRMEERCFGRLSVLFGGYFLDLEGEKDALLRSSIVVITRTVLFTLHLCFPNDSHAKMFNVNFRNHMMQILHYWCSGWVMHNVPNLYWLTPTAVDVSNIEEMAKEDPVMGTGVASPSPSQQTHRPLQPSTEEEEGEEPTLPPPSSRTNRMARTAPLQDSSFDDVDVSDANGGYRLISEFHRHAAHAEDLAAELEKRVNKQHKHAKKKNEIRERKADRPQGATPSVKRVPKGVNYFECVTEADGAPLPPSPLCNSSSASFSSERDSEALVDNFDSSTSTDRPAFKTPSLDGNLASDKDRRDIYVERVRRQLRTTASASPERSLIEAATSHPAKKNKQAKEEESEDSYLTLAPLALCDAPVRAYLVERAGVRYSDVPFPLISPTLEIMAELKEKYNKRTKEMDRKKSCHGSFRRVASTVSSSSNRSSSAPPLSKTSRRIFCSTLDFRPYEVTRSLAERCTQRENVSHCKEVQEKIPASQSSPFVEYYAANCLNLTIGKNESPNFNSTKGSDRPSVQSTRQYHEGQSTKAKVNYITKNIRPNRVLQLNMVRKEALKYQERLGKDLSLIDRRDQVSRHVFISKHIESVTEQNKIMSDAMSRRYKQKARKMYNLREMAEKIKQENTVKNQENESTVMYNSEHLM